MTNNPLSSGEVLNIASEVCGNPDAFEVISHQDWRWVIRYPLASDRSVILKLWARKDVKGSLRRLLKITSSDYEWKYLKYLHEIGLRVPAPLGFSYLSLKGIDFTEILILEDLGPCIFAVEHIKALLSTNDNEGLASFEEDLIVMTQKMIQHSLLDYDHSLVNILVSHGKNKPVRVDVEHLRRVGSVFRHKKLYSRMLATLISSYTYAVQPQTCKVTHFAECLRERISPPPKVMQLANIQIQKNMIQAKKRLRR